MRPTAYFFIATSMKLRINGEIKEFQNSLKLSELLYSLDLKPNGIAIELNKEVVLREKWANVLLREGDAVEIVHFVGGGSGKIDII